MDGERVAALAAAAEDGVDYDGFTARREGDSYVLAVGDGEPTTVPESDLPAAAAEYGAHVSNWYFWEHEAPDADHRRAFLRWLERAHELSVERRYAAMADGTIATTWGQLQIQTTLRSDGSRTYELRHVDDADVDGDTLTTYEDPLAARDLARLDADERYRPLKTAPSLDDGWRFPALEAGALVEAVEAFYPATVANWFREQAGTLDVTHWRETAERQTGIYDVVADLDRDAVERVAASCCVDSECLKRREWEFDEDETLAADPGDGAFPCREPCSLVIAAARKWARLESEETETYAVELTPSEREQLAELVDAVAEGRVDEIREADVGDGANRYRARYLREKRFADGEFGRPLESGTATNGERPTDAAPGTNVASNGDDQGGETTTHGDDQGGETTTHGDGDAGNVGTTTHDDGDAGER